MIRLRPLRAREKRNLRHWAMELVVVVAGVLLALWAAEWAQDREQRKSDAEAIAAMRAEVRYNLLVLSIWRAHSACYGEQLAYIGDLLDRSGSQWPGIRRNAVLKDRAFDPLLPDIYTTFGGVIQLDAWNAAVQTGAINRLDPGEQGTLTSSAITALSYFDRMQRVMEARDQLRGLAYAGTLTDADRFAARNNLAILASSRAWLDRDFDYGVIGLDETEIALLEGQIEEWNDRLSAFGKARDRWEGIKMPIELTKASTQ